MTDATNPTVGGEMRRIAAMTDNELAKLAVTLRKRASLQSALDMADLGVARYEPPSDAVDNCLYRNLEISSRISRLQKLVSAEQSRRATITKATGGT